jgi:hypothetical protein
MAEKKPEKKKGKKGKTKSMHVRKADSGGFIANHQMQPDDAGMAQPDQEHILQDLPQLQQHMADHFGPEEEEQEGK